MRRGVLFVVASAGLAVAVCAGFAAPALASTAAAPQSHGAISLAFVARLATSAVLVGLLVAWVIARMRHRSRR